jgi:hypothetical protein
MAEASTSTRAQQAQANARNIISSCHIFGPHMRTQFEIKIILHQLIQDDTEASQTFMEHVEHLYHLFSTTYNLQRVPLQLTELAPPLATYINQQLNGKPSTPETFHVKFSRLKYLLASRRLGLVGALAYMEPDEWSDGSGEGF